MYHGCTIPEKMKRVEDDVTLLNPPQVNCSLNGKEFGAILIPHDILETLLCEKSTFFEIFLIITISTEVETC